MNTYYILELDYEWREISTKTETTTLPSLEAVRARIEEEKKYGKFEGFRLYKVEKTLIDLQENENVPNMG